MNTTLLYLYFIPLLSSLILTGPVRFREKTIARLTLASLSLPALTSFYLIVSIFMGQGLPLEQKVLNLNLYGHHFDFTVWMDFKTILMLILTHTLGLLVLKFSHGYLHLEKGYQRFFATILFFIFGMYVLTMAGTIDMFFAGWEIVGISSFFLISFYRDHTRSVTNAWRIYNIYRLCDVGLLMGAVLGHLLWHEATRFSEIVSLTSAEILKLDGQMLLILSLFIILAAVGKSAQFPFHNWPGRAMEGPTPSSAIFYGALSIHAGVYLLIRTHNLWSHVPLAEVLIFSIGLLTLIFSTLQGRMQSNIKGQIAYASTAQIGLMFMELSLGWVMFTMIHLFCHALYRCFQLLVSASVVAHSLTLNKVEATEQRQSLERKLPRRLEATLYSLGMNDFSLDVSWRGFTFVPWRRLLYYLKLFLSHPYWSLPVLMLLAPLPVTGPGQYLKHQETIPIMLSSVSLFFSLRSLLIHHSGWRSMIDLTVSLVLDMVGAAILDKESMLAIWLYMGSVFPFLVLGIYLCREFRHLDLRNYHAEGTAHPVKANLFMIAFMVISGMPVSLAFFGEDILLEELIKHSHLMAFFTSISLMINGLVCVKIYTRIFMGKKA